MQRKMKRSRWLLEGAATLGAIDVVRAPASAAEFSYKLAHGLPVDNPIHVRLVQMANAIKAETSGRTEIHIFPNGQLGSLVAVLEQMRLGSIQLVVGGDSAYTGILPVYAIDNIGFAFSSWQQPIDVMSGRLGAYLRRELLAKGVYAFDRSWSTGFTEVTTSTKPIRTADDFVGVKIRVPASAIVVELFKTLGALPAAIDGNAIYTALQTHLVDAQENSVSIIESYRLYEVQAYLSLTNHRWGGLTMSINGDAWNALGPDIQSVFHRNAEKYANLSNNDTRLLNDSLADKLRRQGLVFNSADTATMRARLASYYARWKKELGSTAWDMLEEKVGKLG